MNRAGGSRARWTGGLGPRPGRSDVGASGDASIKYKEALAWLYSLQRFGIKLGLENIRRLIAELDVDLGNARVIHVAGTNGKGSVCATIDSICRAQGYRSALFTSPHLVTFRERIRVNGEMISEHEVASGLTNIRELVRDWELHPTFFEVTTALALKHFANSKIDIVVLETGLGGRLDATNAIQPNVVVITPIALDHQQWLGDSLAKIAGEKAGIIKPQTAVIAGPQFAEAEKVIRARASECQAPIEFVDQPYTKTPIALRGNFQKLNAAIAVAAAGAAKIDINESAIARGLATVEWPARFQCWDNRTIIDGAHNPAAAKILAQAWRAVFAHERVTLILAVLSDKDLRGICEALVPMSDLILLPKIRTERAVDPAALQRVLADLGSKSEASASFGEAFTKARAQSKPILITGSLHFAGEALAHLQGKAAAFEECAQ
ncbi:MAG: bifunctional folylpolyglutamate synthase/dihydrofolate synthase [Verrucomicrobia bacterium]|nr:bifunctional folylpolyglutamate synthase/dihydrofolate synthase [Verrucomicrobiota bacterium]